MSFAVYSPGVGSVVDVRRNEIGQLLTALEALRDEGFIDLDEFRTKRRALLGWSCTRRDT